MNGLSLIVDTHPVQYRAPLYRELDRRAPGSFEVFYGSDFSVRGYRDAEFGLDFAWDVPLLEGYPSMVGDPEDPHSPSSCRKLVDRIRKDRPHSLLLTDLRGPLFETAIAEGRRCGAELWLRTETQDEAFPRSALKGVLRGLYYRFHYRTFTGFLAIGRLNREHYMRHGVPASRVHAAPYATLDPFLQMKAEEKAALRERLRAELGVAAETFVIGFFGKLIQKKNPGLLFEAVAQLPSDLRRRTLLLFVGSGELEGELRRLAETEARTGARSHFAGFVNQRGLPDYYLASDVVALPSRRAGETWGLVINEGLQAGCAVVISAAAGCSAEFIALTRVRVVAQCDARATASALAELAGLPRDFTWCQPWLEQNYSMAVAARGIAGALRLGSKVDAAP